MNQLRTLLFAVIASFVLGGCGADQPVGPQAETKAPELTSSTREAATAAPAGQDAIDASLKTIGGLAPLAVRYDRIGKTKAGVNQRQVFVEMLGATAEQTEEFASGTFEAAGFTVRKGLVDEKGIRLQYKKAGIEPLNVLIRTKAASPPLNDAAATSSLYIKQEVL